MLSKLPPAVCLRGEGGGGHRLAKASCGISTGTD